MRKCVRHRADHGANISARRHAHCAKPLQSLRHTASICAMMATLQQPHVALWAQCLRFAGALSALYMRTLARSTAHLMGRTANLVALMQHQLRTMLMHNVRHNIMHSLPDTCTVWRMLLA
jgi:hypothetical protein